MRTLLLFCLPVLWFGLVTAKPRPLFYNDLMEDAVEDKIDDDIFQSKSRTKRQSVTSYKETKQQLRLLKVRMDDIQISPCDPEDVLKGVQCPEEDKCIKWSQVCDEVQDCGLPQLGECLNQTVQQYRIEREDLCNGDENREWCDLKRHIPRRCGEDIDLSQQSGNRTARIVSPNYPRQYPSDIFCYWMVKTSEGGSLSVSFKKFDTEPNYDFFSLGVGAKENEEEPSSYLIYKHSGPELPDPASFRIQGNQLWISFKSDDWDNYSGFEIHVADTSVFDPGNVAKSPFPDAKNTSCGGRIRLDIDGEETITTPNYPENYGNYFQCDWVIRIVPGRRIGISFKTFTLETNQDFVEIGSGGNPGTDAMTKLTGRSVPSKAVLVENNVAWIRFTSDPANTRRGFMAVVRDQPYNGCGGEIAIPRDGSIVVASPLFPDLGYRINLNCIWKFTGDPERLVSVVFKEFSTEKKYDTVSAGIGPSPARDGSNYVIQSHSGNTLPDPAGFDSPTNEAWIYFRSDASVIDRGFKVEISDTSIISSNYTPEAKPTREPDTNCGGEVTGGRFSTKLVINSPGRPYRKFLDCLWEVDIPFGGRVRIFFTEFNTEGSRDILFMGNGTDPDEESSIFLTHSGRNKPKEIRTVANKIWMRFVTDSVNEFSGWTAIIEALPYNECGGYLFIPTDGSLTIGSPNFPYNYLDNQNCYYQINGAPGRRIEVNFLEFTTEARMLDYLSIGEGCLQEGGDIIVGNHSGYGVPPPGRFFSRRNAVWMRFHSNEVNTYQGFLINFADATTPADDSGARCEVFVPPTMPPTTTKKPFKPVIYQEVDDWSGVGPGPDWYYYGETGSGENPGADNQYTMTDFDYSSPAAEETLPQTNEASSSQGGFAV
ncbi:tolloid-like protein 2 [Diadema antillarum]|uniref:tolloid-like protein 2 n=1 Tax=Diadema antillarum TaxID=105358 RepID=UPI003A8709CC